MTEFDTSQIETAKITKFDGEVPFSVVFLPRTPSGEDENPSLYYDNYYLRTGESKQEIVSAAQKEFEGYGFPANRFDSNWLSGKFIFQPESVNLQRNLQGICR